MCFGCSKELSHRDGSFEYPQHMFWLRNKKNNFLLHTVVWGPDLCIFPTAIEDDYEGPQLDNGKVTEDFVKQLMDTFRDQKKLHRKYAYQVFF